MDLSHITFGEVVVAAVLGFVVLAVLLTVLTYVARGIAALARAFTKGWRTAGPRK